MQKFALTIIVVLAIGAVAETASAVNTERAARRYSRTRPWHGEYANTTRGGPVPLIVPPNVHLQRKMGWGVAQSSMTPIYHRYYRNYQGQVEIEGGYPFRATPNWPSHTDQFGVYYIRGPW